MKPPSITIHLPRLSGMRTCTLRVRGRLQPDSGCSRPAAWEARLTV